MSALLTPPPARRRSRIAAAAVALAVLVAACGGDDDENVVADATKDTGLPTLSAPTTLESAEGKECQEATDVPEAEGKPTVEMPDGEPPTELVSTDITPGDGAEAEVGKAIKVNYVGIACSTGMQFDSSWDSGMPADFTLEEGGLIEGWVEGIPGMKVGGRRQLVIPADLAYGEAGNTGIAPDEALVFVIDLLEVSDPPAEGATTAPVVPGEEVPTEGATEGGSATTAPANGESTTTTATDEDPGTTAEPEATGSEATERETTEPETTEPETTEPESSAPDTTTPE